MRTILKDALLVVTDLGGRQHFVAGTLRGPLAVHPQHHPEAKRGWYLAHAGTGLTIRIYPTKGRALAALRELHGRPEWAIYEGAAEADVKRLQREHPAESRSLDLAIRELDRTLAPVE